MRPGRRAGSPGVSLSRASERRAHAGGLQRRVSRAAGLTGQLDGDHSQGRPDRLGRQPAQSIRRAAERRTRRDYARCVRELVEIHYPRARKIRLVQDNLNTHDGASLYEAFLPNEARCILDKIEFHYTPKHGSWLNMAETETRYVTTAFSRRVTLSAVVVSWPATSSMASRRSAGTMQTLAAFFQKA